jgi:hypothetical protein
VNALLLPLIIYIICAFMLASIDLYTVHFDWICCHQVLLIQINMYNPDSILKICFSFCVENMIFVLPLYLHYILNVCQFIIFVHICSLGTGHMKNHNNIVWTSSSFLIFKHTGPSVALIIRVDFLYLSNASHVQFCLINLYNFFSPG